MRPYILCGLAALACGCAPKKAEAPVKTRPLTTIERAFQASGAFRPVSALGCYDYFNVYFPLTWRANSIPATHQVRSLPSYGLRPGTEVGAAVAALDRAAAGLGLRPNASTSWRRGVSGQRFRTYAFGDATDREYFSVMLDPDFTPPKTCVAQVENTQK